MQKNLLKLHYKLMYRKSIKMSNENNINILEVRKTSFKEY